ncbi:YIP1 family protein [Haematobacter massiliensis]|uniref:Yip1 domain-containing protein n=1 Tax=Haematobacter massiliensis TaxID=195105 RepID=A0A086YC81_9RHOB|nr:YIP1 family protein [Haematobacter massiliensis]KFI31881.1 hypothetical protein CN97_05555 [Haematobacter massiliensis]OWJ72486.1 YIP1 family protein [Haematobacter massiliensis]OWJ87840.1 YIP1 family protein [Haematobacter massiliensis]QBJ24276.1 YIP1 family protein [Haematobacter massiliensis]
MAITTEILRSYRTPGAVVRRRLLDGVREDRALAVLMAACLVMFVAQWPRLAREAHLDPTIPLDARLGGALLGWLFLAPLFFYLLAGLSHLVARLLGGRGSYHSARVALFWSLLAAAPLFLLNGLVAGLVGPSTAATATGIVVLAVFLTIWFLSLAEAERPQPAMP